MLGLSAIAALPLGDARGVPYTMTVSHGTYTLSLQGAGKLITDIYPSGQFTLDGRAAGLSAQRPFSVDAGSFASSGHDVQFDYGFGIVVDSASYTLTVQDVTFDTGFGLVGGSGSYTLTGQDINSNISMNALSGQYSLIGSELFKGVSEVFESGTFTLTLQNSDVTAQFHVSTDAGALTVVGKEADFRGFFSAYVPPEIWTEVS